MDTQTILRNRIGSHIYSMRESQVMLDNDLAEIYEIETRVLKQAVRRNINRFPDDFMFQPTEKELDNLRSQNEISSLRPSCGQHGGTRYLPFAFTELGIAMLSSVLRSEKAAQVNIQIMRVFVEFRKQQKSYQFDFGHQIHALKNELEHLKEKVRTIEVSQFEKKVERPVEAIQEKVAQHWGLQIEDLTSKARKGSIALARQVAMYLVRQNLFLSLGEIGSHFGRRDHTTVLHALHKVESMLNENIIFRNTVSSLAI